MIKVLLFDLNGTLLDTSALRPRIHAIFNGKLSVDSWFDQVIQHAMAATLAGEYREFGHIAIAVLQMNAAARGINLSSSDIHKVQTGLQRLPPFPDVKSALRTLRASGFRLAVLTNSAPAAMQRQLQSAGLSESFHQPLSVHAVGRFKPAPEPYAFAAQQLNVHPGEILMVAAHHWDLWGASRAGLQTAFLQRPNKSLFPEAPLPHYVAADLKQLATLLTSAPSSPKREMNSSRAKPAALAAVLLTGLMTGVLTGVLNKQRR